MLRQLGCHQGSLLLPENLPLVNKYTETFDQLAHNKEITFVGLL
jgi:hypothetical protein